MDANGANEKRLTHHRLMDIYPAWSPDGERIVYASMNDADSNANSDLELHVMNPDGANKTRLTDNELDEAVPAWSPDGSQIAFQFEQNGRWTIYLMNADGSNRRELINNAGWAAQPKWTPLAKSSNVSVKPLRRKVHLWGQIKQQ